MVNCQVGFTSKPVGMDALNPAVSAAAQQNSGTSDSVAKAGDVKQTKPAVVPTAPTAKEVAAAARDAELAAKAPPRETVHTIPLPTTASTLPTESTGSTESTSPNPKENTPAPGGG
jgi:hypothetical protein